MSHCHMETTTAPVSAAATATTTTTTTTTIPHVGAAVTEAQLRWAQFHHKRNESIVKAKIRELWQTPASPSQVEGALSDDARSTTTEEGENDADDNANNNKDDSKTLTLPQRHQRRNKPVISKGRRALLRVSKRNFLKRKEHVDKHGFHGTVSFDDNDASSMAEYMDDDLAAIFAEATVRRRRRLVRSRRRSRRSSCYRTQEEERIHRFESAFRAMMEALAAAAAQPAVPVIPTKKWTRSAEHVAQITVDGKEYMDLKWGVMANHHSSKQHQQHGGSIPDRGASWLVHNTPALHMHNNTNVKTSQLADQQGEASLHNAHCLDFFQHRQLFEEYSNHDHTQNTFSALPIPKDAVGFVKQFVKQMEQAAAVEKDLISADGKLHKPTFAMLVRRYLGQTGTSPAHQAWKSPLALAHVRKSAGSIARARRCTNQHNDEEEKKVPELLQQQLLPSMPLYSGFVRNFIEQIEKAADEESLLVTDDGKLDTIVFERLVTRYLAQAADLSLQQHDEGELLSDLATPARRSSYLKDSKGLSSGVLAHGPGRISLLASNRRQSHASNFTAPLGKRLSSAFDKHRQEVESPAMSPPPKQSVRESFASYASSAFGELRQWNKKAQSCDVAEASSMMNGPFNNLKGDVVIDEEPTSEIQDDTELQEETGFDNNGVGEDSQENDQNAVTADGAVSDVAQSTVSSNKSLETSSKVSGLANRLTDSVSGRVGGWMRRLNNNVNKSVTEVEADDDNNTESEIRAVAAFHKTQDGRRAMDDSSSASSFRVLPEGIKKVVKNFGWRRFHSDGFEQSFSADDSVMMQSVQEDQELGASSFETSSSYRTTTSTTSAGVALSPERLKEFHSKMMERSALFGGADTEQTIIDTDGNSDISGVGGPHNPATSLLLSPTILTKRHQQAIRAIENRNWEQIFYLMSANPWLAEMNDHKSGQYLLHKLAYYGAGEVNVDSFTGEVVSIRHPVAPEQTNTDMIRMFSSAVHKFDHDGNLPLHFACASGNLPMMKLLGDRFPGGASVRNEDGMLPLHLAILACAAPISAFGDSIELALETVKTILSYFPSAVGVTDNEGNLPIHTAASVLVGDVGVDIVFLLVDEAERQVRSESGVRFRNKAKLDELGNLSAETDSTATPTDSADNFDEVLHCTMVYNNRRETPLTAAILARAGWEVIEALSCGENGAKAAFVCDAERNTALHLLASNDFFDPEAILSVLELAPEVSSVRNTHGMLPIEVACIQNLPQEVIAAILLADLPIDIDRKHDVRLIKGKGASWWYLACDCDDFYVDLVEELIRVCTFQQVLLLSSIKESSGDTLLTRATPLCRSVLQSALRLEGRFELTDSEAVFIDSARGVKVFKALDFGDASLGESEGRPVLLKSFAKQEAFEHATVLLKYDLNFTLVEENVGFTCDLEKSIESPMGDLDKYFIAIEQPNLTLRAVMQGMLQSESCQKDDNVRQRYASKVFAVLRNVAKAIWHLHSLGFVHGNVNLDNCRRYDNSWKLADIIESQEIGSSIRIYRLSSSSPPECTEPLGNNAGKHRATFRSDYVCSPALDCWSFGRLSFEALVGRSLIQLDERKRFEEDHRAMMDVLHWNSFNCDEVCQDLKRVGVPDSGAQLISRCLSPNPNERPSMEDVLANRIWRELRETKRIDEH